jgi:hypothetical protein
MHDVVIAGVPLSAIFAGILLNWAEVKEVRGEMKELRGEMNARFNAVDAELRYFHGYTGKLEGRIEAMEKRQS